MLTYKELEITKYQQSGFRIDFKNLHVYIDPFRIPENQPKADIIFITHEHFDHLDKESINKILGENTVVVGNKLVYSAIGNEVDNYIETEPCGSGTIKDIKFTSIAAHNTNKFRAPNEPYHPKENNGVGFVLDFYGGEKFRVYHMGDTDFVMGEHSIPEVDILLIPVSGTYVMTSDEAIEAANAINPQLAIPIHFDANIVGTSADAENFKNNAVTKVEILEPFA